MLPWLLPAACCLLLTWLLRAAYAGRRYSMPPLSSVVCVHRSLTQPGVPGSSMIWSDQVCLLPDSHPLLLLLLLMARPPARTPRPTREDCPCGPCSRPTKRASVLAASSALSTTVHLRANASYWLHRREHEQLAHLRLWPRERLNVCRYNTYTLTRDRVKQAGVN